MKRYCDDFIKFTDRAMSAYHSVAAVKEALDKEGYEAVPFNGKLSLKKGGSYYMDIYGTTLIAFTIGKRPSGRLHIAAAHTDYPCLKIKPSPESTGDGYAKVNCIVYGGPIYDTWLDRPLGVAGRVVLKSKDIYKPKEVLFDSKKPVLYIPNLAIHMNREVNKGVAINPQTELMPLAAVVTEKLNKEHFFTEYLAKELKVKAEDILDFDLAVYETGGGCYVGINDEFISSPRIDNQTSVYSCLVGLVKAGVPKAGINMSVFYDNEEIGSRTKQGADSTMLGLALDKIYEALGFSEREARDIILDGFTVSLDVAHAVHPTHGEKADPTNRPVMTKGVVLKEDLNQKYATDVFATSVIRQLLNANEIPYQVFVNRNDVPGGSTLGSISSSHLPMLTVDMGIPILAMHSARELMGAADQESMDKTIEVFFAN